MAYYFKSSMRAAPTITISTGTAGTSGTEGFWSSHSASAGNINWTASAEL